MHLFFQIEKDDVFNRKDAFRIDAVFQRDDDAFRSRAEEDAFLMRRIFF